MGFSVPFSFTPGSVAQSAQVNSNFAANVSAENTLAAQITALQAGQIPAPQGRLTLASLAPVQITNVTNAGTVYYSPYQGALVPIYNGTSTSAYSFTEKSLILDASSHTSTHIYDVFAYLASAVVTIGTGPAWSTNTARSAALTRFSTGFFVNNATITLTNNSAGVSVDANQATYLGSIYCNGNAQVSFNVTPAAAAGGGGNILGVYNAYNRIGYSARNIDSTLNVVNNSASSWRPFNSVSSAAPNSNAIFWLDGLGQSPALAMVTSGLFNPSGVGSYGAIGVNFNSPSVAPDSIGGASNTASPVGGYISANAASLPVLGLNYAQAMYFATGNSLVFGISSTVASEQLTLSVDL